MINSFKCLETEKIFKGQRSKKYNFIAKVAKRKLDLIHFAHNELDLKIPPNNHFEHLKRDLAGLCSIRINDQFRIVFRFENGQAYDVQIMDYH
jgi:proteic killer suppression protein